MFDFDPSKKRLQKETGQKGVEAEFVKAIQHSGGKAYKFTSEMNRGVSDRLVVFPNQVWFVEIKREGGKLTPLQKNFQAYIEHLDLNHFVVVGKQGINQFLEKVNDKS